MMLRATTTADANTGTSAVHRSIIVVEPHPSRTPKEIVVCYYGCLHHIWPLVPLDTKYAEDMTGMCSHEVSKNCWIEPSPKTRQRVSPSYMTKAV